MTTWDLVTSGPSLPPGMMAQLAQLRAALPGYDVIITSHSGTYRFEAIRPAGGTGPWCLISTDPADLWHELTPHSRHGASSCKTFAPSTPAGT